MCNRAGTLFYKLACRMWTTLHCMVQWNNNFTSVLPMIPIAKVWVSYFIFLYNFNLFFCSLLASLDVGCCVSLEYGCLSRFVVRYDCSTVAAELYAISEFYCFCSLSLSLRKTIKCTNRERIIASRWRQQLQKLYFMK